MTTRVERSVDIEQPVRTVYAQWTQFEDWPEFMDDVEHVEQIADDELRWHVATSTANREWVAKITEQIPDKRVAWRTLEGPKHSGVVTFHRVKDDLTRVMVQLDFVPEGFLENIADALGTVSRWVEDELETFKAFVEERGQATGEWRGEIDHHAHEPESGATVTKDEAPEQEEEKVTEDDRSSADDRSSGGDPGGEGSPHRAVDHRESA